MVPGKTYTPEDYLWLAWRRKWFILVPALLVAAGVAVWVQLLPDRYRSETLILVVPQRVPESFVRSTVTARIEDRLQSITQQILSRTRLEAIIDEFDLYADERADLVMEDVVVLMRRSVDVQLVRGDAFRVSYVSQIPQVAMRVTERLASLFIEENLRDREVLAEGTSQFIESQLNESRRRLLGQEQRVMEYQRKFAGQLPQQLDSNLEIIRNVSQQVQIVAESLGRDRDRLLVREGEISDDLAEERADNSRTAAVVDLDGGIAADQTIEQQLEGARGALRIMESRFKAEHPDIIRQNLLVERLAEKAAGEKAARRGDEQSPAPARPISPAERARQNRLRNLRAEVDGLKRDVARKTEEEDRLRQQIVEYQARVEATPGRQLELTELTRDYSTIQQLYNDLLEKREDAKIAANLERRQIGEQFKVLDPARVPEKPFSPLRRRLNLMGAGAGLAFGLGFVMLLEYRDTSLRTEADVAAALSLPVLATIPLLTTPESDRRKRRRTRLLVLAVALVTIVVVGAAVAILVPGADLTLAE